MTDKFLGKWNEIKNGDCIRLNYGTDCGEAFGKVYGKWETQWGQHIRVKLDDNTFTQINGLVEKGIGAYLVG